MSTTSKYTAAMTKDELVLALVDLDVAKWGEGEREASRKSHVVLSHGRAMLALGNRLILGNIDAKMGRALVKASKTIGYAASERRDMRDAANNG